MGSVSTYLNFEGKTEEAFEFYKSVFRTEFVAPGYHRFGDMPSEAGQPEMPEHIKHQILNVQLPILGGHILMGTDTVPEWGHKTPVGNNVSIVLHPDSREEADSFFRALGVEGSITMPMEDQFWGDYYGSLTDKYGIQWMVTVSGR